MEEARWKKLRRYTLLFMALSSVISGSILYLYRNGLKLPNNNPVSVVSITGEIGTDPGGVAERIIPSLRRAFENSNSKGVILRINSPGGSPVQSGYINDEIRRLRVQYPNIPLYVVVEDMCASGGYYIAAAADKIYVNKASIVGSIGVLMDGFGFTGTMEKLGVERRLMTAGENKGFMDPFSPRNPKHEEYTRKMLAEIHQQFIDVVKQGRGKRLHETPETFSGLFWSGEQSIKMGLADEIGSVDSVARDVIKAEDIVDFTTHEGIADRLAKKFGAGVASAFPGFGAQGGGVTLR